MDNLQDQAIRGEEMNFILRYIDKQFAKLVRAYQFASDTLYYWQRGHGMRQAFRMARDTIPAGRWQ